MIPVLRIARFPLCLLLVAIAVVAACPTLSTAAPANRWALSYGKGADQVGFENASTKPKFEEPAAWGPQAFRVHGETLWVADSVGGRILAFGADGKRLHTIAVPGVASNTLLEDFALVPGSDGSIESIWVADGADLIVRRISVPDGRELARFGGPLPASGSGTVDRPGRFAQIHQLEVGSDGRVYVGDYGRAIVAVCDAAGKLLHELPWLRTGFVVLPGEKLCFPVWSENAGWSLKTWNADGVLVESISLGSALGQNVRLWARTATGATLTCIPNGGFRGYLHLVQLGVHGQVISRQPVRPTPAMNRFLDLGAMSVVYRASADYDAAPKGAFEVLPLPAGGDPSAIGSESEVLAVIATAPVSAIQVIREKVAVLPGLTPEMALGLRTSGDLAIVASRDGKWYKIALKTGEVKEDALGRPVNDFALLGSTVIGLGTDGTLTGACPETWTRSAFPACRLETAGNEGLLTGGFRTRYLPAPPATQPVDLDDPPMAIPFRDGLLWAMRRQASSRVWHAELMDMCGNRMKRVYRFAPEFDPAGLTLEPLSPEGELLLSFWTANQRELALIGQNGRMFWRLPVGEPACPRDLGWDHEGRLLMLESDGTGLVLQRLKFVQPEG